MLLFVVSGLTFITHAQFLGAIASFLLVEDPLEPAAAIVPLGGQIPFREIEAARLYYAGWAPGIVIVRGALSDESDALNRLGMRKIPEWELARQVLIKQGVRESSIRVAEDEAAGTLEELRAVYNSLTVKSAPVILVTSKYHTRRARLTWQYVTGGRSQAIVRVAAQDPFEPSRWWRERRFVLSVVREYLGLANYYAGFPVAP